MKVALWLMGLFSSPVFRRPLRPLGAESIEQIRRTLQSIGYETVN
jgi:dihydrodipicolinate synthase/N-acetylneuraminate lyase